jgi:leucyl aminopeptidase
MKQNKTMAIAALLASLLAMHVSAQAGQKTWVSLDEHGLALLKQIDAGTKAHASVQSFQAPQLAAANGANKQSQSLHLIEVDEDKLAQLTQALHASQNRCVGFIGHKSKEDGLATLKAFSQPFAPLATVTKPTYKISNQSIVTPMLAQMQATNIGQTIVDLSSNTNRDYKTQYGVAASNWLKNRWLTLGKGRTDFTVEQFTHANFPMKSVIATIKGTDKAAEVIVLSAHLDSINARDSSEANRAPGADDDASGVASITEVLRVMAATGYKPRRTIKFMAYSGEERGLLGSQDIANSYKAQGINMVGMMQLDMTEYKGSSKDMYIFDDMTNAAQNTFVANIIKTYLPTMTVGHDVCGYACSDHASWYRNGYVASQVHEASFSADNKQLHTPNDTYAYLQNKATNSLKFARMTAAYAVELGSEGAVVAK